MLTYQKLYRDARSAKYKNIVGLRYITIVSSYRHCSCGKLRAWTYSSINVLINIVTFVNVLSRRRSGNHCSHQFAVHFTLSATRSTDIKRDTGRTYPRRDDNALSYLLNYLAICISNVLCQFLLNYSHLWPQI